MKQIIASLDIGSSNIKLIVGEIHRDKLFVLACSKVESKGIKKGIIVNEEEAYSSIKEAFKKAQGILGIKLTRVVLVVPSYFASFVKSEGYTTIDREDNFVNGDDITKALQASVFNRVSPNLELVSVTPKEFIINETSSVKDPKGIEAHRLSVNSLLGLIPKKNIYLTIDLLEKMDVKVVDLVFGGLCDYFEFKNEENNEKSTAVINIGSNKTEISIIKENILISTEVLDIGSRNIDRDISYIYDISLDDSKKIKEKFALASRAKASTSEVVETLTKSNERIKINQYEVSDIVYSRIREILELSKKQINFLTKEEISYIIVTGGTSEIDGFESVFKEIFGKNKVPSKVEELGCRSNIYSTGLGAIKVYHEKLKFRNKFATTISEEEQGGLFSDKKKINESSLLGKVYSYFFDN